MKPIILLVLAAAILLPVFSYVITDKDAVRSPLIVQNQTSNNLNQTKKTDPEQARIIKVYDLKGKESGFVIDQKHPVLFYATWCSHCQKLLPKFYELYPNNNLTYVEVFSNVNTGNSISLSDVIEERVLNVRNFIKKFKSEPDESKYYLIKDEESTPVSKVITLFYIENGELKSSNNVDEIEKYVKSHNQ